MTDRSKLLDTIATGAYWGAGVTFQRSNAVPLEKYSIFGTLAKAQEYALVHPVSYPGQPVAVVADDDSVKFYIISAHILEQAKDAAAWAKLTDEQKLACITPEDRAKALIEISTSAGLDGESDRVDGLIEGVNATISTLTGRVDTAEDDIDALEGRATALEGRAKDLEDRATAVEGRATALEGRADGFDTEIANLKKADENLTAAIATAKQEAINHANSLKHFSTKIVEAESEMTEANVLYLMLDADAVADGRKDVYLQYLVIDGSPVCIGDTTTDLDNYYTEAEADAEIAAAVSAAKEELQGKLDALTSTHNKDKGDLGDAIDAVAEDLAQEVADRKAADSALDAKIAANKTDIGTNAQAIEDLAAVVAGHESDIEAKMVAVNARVDNANTEIANIKTDIQNLNTTYATDVELAAVKTALEEDIDAEVETINAALDDRYVKGDVYNKDETDDQIAAAINALDVTDTAVAKQFVTAVSEADGKISISRAQPSHSDISGFDTQVAAVAQPLVNAEKERAEGVEGGLASRISTLETFKETTVPATYATKSELGTVDTAQKATATELASYKTSNDAAVAAVVKSVEDLGARHDSELSTLESNVDKDYLKKSLKINAVEYDATNNKYTIAPADIGADVAGSAATAKSEAVAAAKTYTDTEVEKVSSALSTHESTAAQTYVPKTLKVNNKALSGDINLTYTDVNADVAGTAAAEAGAALTSAKAYTDARELKIREDFGAADSTLDSNLRKDLVAKTTTVNGHALSANIALDYSDVGADAAGTAQTLASQAETNAKTAATNALNIYKEEVTKSLGDINTDLTTNYVKNTLKVNGQAIGANNEITLTPANVGADVAGTAETKANAALASAKSYTDTREDAIEEAYKAADSALGSRIDGIINDTYVKYNTVTEFIIDCGNAAGEHPVYNA